jgi:hypothetical protein
MAYQFVHLWIRPKADVAVEQIEKKLNDAKDWYRYAEGTYVIFTALSTPEWERRLGSLVVPEGSFLLAPLDLSRRMGWMPKSLIAWVDSNMARQNEE